jgi:hypothetical protein
VRIRCGLLIAVALSVSCGRSSTPVGPSVPTVTATFAGTLSPNGLQFRLFETTQIGSVSITVTPTILSGAPSTARIGVGLGVPLSVAPFCGIVDGVPVGIGRSTRWDSTVGMGVFCAAVYDIGELTGDISFTATVEHPL